MADQDGLHPHIMTQLLRHVISSPHDADVKRDTFRHTILPPNFVFIAFVFSELRSGGEGILSLFSLPHPCPQESLLSGWLLDYHKTKQLTFLCD